MAKTRRTYTPEFKAEAVKLVTEQGRCFAEAAAHLGITENLLRKGKQNRDAEGDHAFPGKGNLPALQEELRRLHAENKRLQILKKATVFFAKESLGNIALSRNIATRGDCWDNAPMESFFRHI
jgi:transposase